MICKNCGKCCQNVGRNMWVFTEHPLVVAMKKRLPYGPDYGEPCDMLQIKDGLSICLIEKYLGTKPKVCREHFCKGE